MTFGYRKVLNYLLVITLVFAPVGTLYAANNQHMCDMQEMSAAMDHGSVMTMDAKCHHDMAKKCSCDSIADQCKCAMHMNFSAFIQNNLNISDNLSNTSFPLYLMNHIKYESTPLKRPPIA